MPQLDGSSGGGPMKQKTWVLGIAAVLVAVTVTGMAVMTSAKPAVRPPWGRP